MGMTSNIFFLPELSGIVHLHGDGSSESSFRESKGTICSPGHNKAATFAVTPNVGMEKGRLVVLCLHHVLDP